MAFTADQLARLEKAMATGTLSVRYADRSVTYQTLREMTALRDQMRSELEPTKQKTSRFAGFRRGH